MLYLNLTRTSSVSAGIEANEHSDIFHARTEVTREDHQDGGVFFGTLTTPCDRRFLVYTPTLYV